MADLNAALLLLSFSEAKPNQNNAFRCFFFLELRGSVCIEPPRICSDVHLIVLQYQLGMFQGYVFDLPIQVH